MSEQSGTLVQSVVQCSFHFSLEVVEGLGLQQLKVFPRFLLAVGRALQAMALGGWGTSGHSFSWAKSAAREEEAGSA